jgi:serine/threonine protein kinase
MTRYASTQHYMAPEAMLVGEGYGEFVDIWSAGCIFAELLQGKALFPGQNDIHQFHIITEMLGHPPRLSRKG